MIPLGVRRGLTPTVQRFFTGVSEQLKRFLGTGSKELRAAHAASKPTGPVLKRMPLFSSILEEVETETASKAALGKEPFQVLQPEAGPPSPSLGATASSIQRVDAGHRTIHYKVRPGDTLWNLGVKKFHVRPEDVAQENKIKDPKRLKAGQIIKVTLPRYTGPKKVIASWYGKEHHGKLMANGEPFNMYAPTIAHKELPLGTRVELVNPRTGQRVIATVTDRGPYIEGREVDLSYGLAKRLGMVERGVGELVMKVLG